MSTDSDEISLQYFAEANNKSEKMWNYHLMFTKLASGLVLVLSLISIIHCYTEYGHINAAELYTAGKLMYDDWNICFRLI